MRQMLAVGVIVKRGETRAAIYKKNGSFPVSVTRQCESHLERIVNHYDVPQLRPSIENAERLLPGSKRK